MKHIKVFNFLKNLPQKLNRFYELKSKKKIEIAFKPSEHREFNPVTNFDKDFEKFIRSLINKKFPNDGISGEELKKKISKNYFEWIIDPIDGTKVFLVGGSTWSNLIGLSYKKESIIGLANFPLLKKFYLNDHKKSYVFFKKKIKLLKTSKNTSLKKLNIIGSFHGANRQLIEKKILKRLKSRLNLIKLDALSYCLLAEGNIDAIMESNLKSYDIVPLIPIIKKAGGNITTWKNKSPEQGGNILASANKGLHKKLLEILRGI